MSFYVPTGPRGCFFRFGMIWTNVVGRPTYWWTSRRRAKKAIRLVPLSSRDSADAPAQFHFAAADLTGI